MDTQLRSLVNQINKNLQQLKEEGINLEEEKKSSYYNYKESKKTYLKTTYDRNVDLLKKLAEKEESQNLLAWTKDLSTNRTDKEKANLILNKIADLLSGKEQRRETPLKKTLTVNISTIPFEIREEIKEDIAEANRAFNAECYRSTIILCGRILELALHSIYYNITYNDLLEKAPGMGLGTLIAKLREKSIEFDPGLSQQIHLINAVRVSSVHKKKEVFQPTKEQTEAIMLFTLDTINKIFAKIKERGRA